MNSNEFEDTKGIRVLMIIEVIGRPPEHLTETLNNMIEQIDSENGIRVKDKKINEPILMKDEKDFYTSFAEIEVEAGEIMNVVGLIFKYMPSHVEIIHPEFIALKNNSWSEILNELTRRLHGYDEVARIIQFEKSVLEKKVMALTETLEEKKPKEKDGNKKKKEK